MSKDPAIIVDIDGTLACRNPEGQQVDIKGNDTYRGIHDYQRVGEDQLHQHIAEVVRMLAPKYSILVTTGRPDSCRGKTTQWLLEEDVPFDDLFMRATGDYRKDSIVKQEIYEQKIAPHYGVLFALDDRNQVVDMWRSIGVPCLQVAPGDF